jgi:predicted nucleic acid-binding protein
MEKQKTVIDASTAFKWFVEEPGSKESLQLLSDHVAGKILLVVPELLFLEVLNAMRYKSRSLKELEEANKYLWDVQLYIEKTNPFLLQRASNLALKHKLSLYDALYLALSTLHGCPLVTADSELANTPNAIMLKSNAKIK